MMKLPTNQHNRGFTLVELTLAIVVGGLVLIGISGVFAATRNMERIFGTQYNAATQLHITQMTMRRALLTLQILQDQGNQASQSDGVNTEDVQAYEDRSRIILEPDPIYSEMLGAWQPQRFEVVVSAAPIAMDLGTQAAQWARLTDRDENSLDFSTADASGGVIRSVFELRPDGAREQIMRRVGLMDPDPKADEKMLLASAQPTGWTLWWRPILWTEANYLRYGGTPLHDAAGTQDEIRFRLAGAIPLVKDINVCSWTIFKSDEKVTDYEALEMSELPAYAEFDILLNSGAYASWMFEIDWVLGDDPLDLGEEDSEGSNSGSGGDGEDDAGGGNGGGGPGGGPGGSDDRPGGQGEPPDDSGGGGIDLPGNNNSNSLGGGDT